MSEHTSRQFPLRLMRRLLLRILRRTPSLSDSSVRSSVRLSRAASVDPVPWYRVENIQHADWRSRRARRREHSDSQVLRTQGDPPAAAPDHLGISLLFGVRFEQCAVRPAVSIGGIHLERDLPISETALAGLWAASAQERGGPAWNPSHSARAIADHRRADRISARNAIPAPRIAEGNQRRARSGLPFPQSRIKLLTLYRGIGCRITA